MVVPFFSGRLGWHESILLLFMSALTVVSYIGMALAKDLWPDFYLVSFLGKITSLISSPNYLEFLYIFFSRVSSHEFLWHKLLYDILLCA